MRDLRPPKLSDERGVALALAIFALVVIGALVAGIFLSGQLEQRSGANTVQAAKAFQTAEAGLAQVTGAWDKARYNVLPLYPDPKATVVEDETQLTANGGNWYRPTVTRLNERLFFVQVHGEQRAGTRPLASRDVGAFVRLATTTLNVQSALITKGTVQVKGTANISGYDNQPKDWGGCPALAPTLPAIITSGTVEKNGTPTIKGAGDPPYVEKQTIPDSTFKRPFDELKPLATITLGGNKYTPAPVLNAAKTKCDVSQVDNWGEPHVLGDKNYVELCTGVFPVIYRKGDLTLNGGRGQGILLVEGNLTLGGNVEFYGIIITTGTFDASTGTNTVYGAVLSQNANLADTKLAGTPTVNFSSCAVTKALQAGADVVPLGERSWVQVAN